MNKGRNLKERIWALVLAFAMVLGSVLPHVGLVAKAAEIEKTFRFQVTETLNAGQANETALELSGAKVVISGEGTEVCSGETNAKGVVELNGTFDDTKSYTYTVTKQGYKDAASTALELNGSEAVAVKMEMEDIQTSSSEVELNLDNESQKTATVKIADNHAISNQSTSEPGYVWKSNDTSIATVADGTITAAGRGKTDVTVSRNGKERKIGVTVKEELAGMSISVVPGSKKEDLTTDVESVSISVSGMESATGDVQIYKSGEANPIGTIKAPYSDSVKYENAAALKGKVTFIAKYTAGSNDYYFDKDVSTGEITYKKTCQLGLTSGSSEITYGDIPTITVPVDANTVQGRTLSYASDKPVVASVDNTGVVTINGQGTAYITVTATANDEYTKSDAVYKITVNKKAVSILANQIMWRQAKKTYDGNTNIKLVGTVTSNKNNAVKVGDAIEIQAEVQAGEANIGAYNKAKIVSVEAVNDNYDVTLDAVTLAEDAELTGLDITIEKRPLYIQVQKKDAGSVTNLEYGKISAEIDKVIDMYEAAPAGTNGQVDETKAEGVVTGEEETVKTMLSSQVAIVKNELADDAYVGTYKKALKPQWEASADTGNYALYFADEEQYYGSIHVVQESINDEELWKKLSVKKSDGTDLYSNNGVFWAKKNDVLKFETTDTKYTDVKIALGENQYDNILTVGEADVTNGVYLVNEGDMEAPSTRTTSDKTKADQDNQIPEGKIKVDNESPKVEFSTLATDALKALVGDSFEFGNFVKFLTGDHEEIITITDEKSGYTPDNQSYRILKLENDADASGIIKTAALAGEEWQALPETGKITVPAAESGYYVVLVKVVDNVGNEAVYASNGVVVDLDKPSVSLDITTKASGYGEYAGDVAYTIHVTDPATTVASGISEIQVTVTNAGEEVAGDAASYTNTYTLDNDALNQLKGLDQEKSSYTFEELAAKAEYTINGKILKEVCNSNNIKITITAFDQAGNEVTEPIERNLRIDTTKPEILPITYDVTNETGCYKERTMTIQYKERNFDPELAKFVIKENDDRIETTLAALMSDAGKVEGITVAKVPDSGEGKPEEAPSDESIAAYTLKFGPQDGKDITYSVVPSISDKAGNTNETPIEEQIFTIDNVLPVIEVSYDNNDVQNEKYFKAQRVMTLTCTERNFDESNLNFIVDGNEEAPVTIDALDAMDGIRVTKPTEEPVDNKYVYTITFGEAEKDFDFNIAPKVTDKAGNVNAGIAYAKGTKAEKEFTVDMLAPVLEVIYKDAADNNSNITNFITTNNNELEWYYTKNIITATAKITERNFAKEKEFSEGQMNLIYTAENAKGKKVETVSYGESANKKGEWKIGGSNEYSQLFEFGKDANYTLSLNYTDLAGNEVRYDTHYFTIDNDAPDGSIVVEKASKFEKFLEKITFGIFHKEKTKVTFESKDEVSPFIQGYVLYNPGDIHGEQEQLGVSKDNTPDDITLESSKGERITNWNSEGIYKKDDKMQSDTVKENTGRVPYLRVQDKAGNVAFYSADGIIVDNQKPDTFEISIEPEAPSVGITNGEKEIYNSDVPFKISVTDPVKEGEIYAGIKSVSYEVWADGVRTQEAVSYEDDNGNSLEAKDRVQMVKWTQDSKIKPTVKTKDDKGNKINDSNNVVIKVTAEDNAGNVETASKVLAIDTTSPKIDVSYDNNEVENNSYFKNDRVMTITYTERNFFEEGLTFDITVDNTVNKAVPMSVLKDKKQAEEKGIYGISVEEVPDVLVYTQDSDEFRNLEVDRKFTYKIRFGEEDEKIDRDYEIIPYIKDEAANDNTANDIKVNYVDGTKAGEAFTIDEIIPVIDVEYMAGNGKIEPGKNEKERIYESVSQITANVKITERNFSTNADNSFSDGSKQMTLEYTAIDNEKKPVATAKYTDLAKQKWEAVGDIKTKTFVFDKDANYTFALDYTDLAGNKAETHETRYFTKDEKAPTGMIQIRETTWETFLKEITFGFFTNKSELIVMKNSDETSGVKSMHYYKYVPNVEKKGTFAGLTKKDLENLDEKLWIEGNPGAETQETLKKEQQVVYYMRVVDRAGNVTYLNSHEGVIVDKTAPGAEDSYAPKIEITTAQPAQGIYSSNVDFTMHIKDPASGGTYSGLKEVYYEVRNNGTVTQAGNYNAEFADKTARKQTLVKSETVNAQKNNSNFVTIYVKAVDYAGNISEATKDIKIDITAPRVEIKFDNNNPLNGKYYNVTRTATIIVRERNFDRNQIRLNITNTDGTRPTVSGWDVNDSGTSDDNVNTCKVTFSADGDYTMSMSCTDRAGNVSNTAAVSEFTIDKTAPTINVTFDNNNALNGKYYNAARTATITVNEHNFRGSDVRTAITSNTVTPGVHGWSMGGNIHTATVPFTADGNYSFNVNYTDLAGNSAQVYTVNEFVIDQTKPVIEIFDIVDKSANNDVVAPGVRYSDTNHDVNGVSITYKGSKHSEKAVDGTRSNIPNGESIKMADFERTPETDDVYTMVAKVTDLAGNSDEKQVTFSVNRFGSNFELSEESKRFVKDYYNGEEEDIVVVETNVDTLTHRGISCGHDGELTDLVEGTDYTVKESGSEVSWKQYEYTINKENFEEEGTYTITIDSVDRATNEVNNKIKDEDIEFVIDKTAPSVVITGIEDQGQYRVDEREIKVSVADNVAMETVEVYVNGEMKEKPYTAEQILKYKGELPYTLKSSSDWQDVKAVAVDAAGNITDTSIGKTGKEDGVISVMVTSSWILQYYRNTPLFIGSLVGLAAIAFLIIFLIAKRRKDKEEAQN